MRWCAVLQIGTPQNVQENMVLLLYLKYVRITHTIWLVLKENTIWINCKRPIYQHLLLKRYVILITACSVCTQLWICPKIIFCIVSFTIVCTTKALLSTGKPSAIETLHHVLKQNCDSSHTALMRNINKFGLQVCKNIPRDGNCLFTAVCDQLVRVVSQRKHHIKLREEIMYYMKCNSTTVSFPSWSNI